MENDIEMDEHGFTLRDLVALLVAGGAMLIEEFIKHPIGAITAIIGLLYMFDRWKTQRVIYKIKLAEHERITRDSEERKKGTKE
jgi:hypothetical protein